MVHQHFKLVECFSVLDNIILGVEPTKGLFPREKECPCKSHGAERKIRSDGRSDALISDITVGMQQRTEILKMLYRDNEVLIFRRADRGSDAAGNRRADEDHEEPRKRRKKSILFITHKLNEIMEVADRCTILRKGKYIGTVNISETSKEELPHDGRKKRQLSVNKKPSKPGDTVLKVEHMTVLSKVRETTLSKMFPLM